MSVFLARRKSILVAFTFSILFIFGYTSAMPATSQSYNNCGNTNYVIGCGVSGAGDVNNHFNDPGVADIYSYFGISQSDVSSMGSDAVLGDVYSNGDVKIQKQVNGETKYLLVATNAMTAGRDNISGSTKVTSGGTVFYVRSPSVSFRSSPLTAYVTMASNGQFRFAILKDCGNPVKATPVPMPGPKPSPQPKPVPQPSPMPSSQPPAQAQSQSQSQTQSQSVTVNQPSQTQMPNTTTNNYYTQPQQQAQTTAQTTYTKPAPAPTTVYVAPSTTKLPNTGPGNVLAMASVFGTFAGAVHYIFFGRRGSGYLSGVKYF